MSHPKQERTLVLIKPDGVQRSLIGEIIHRFERVGLKFLALKMIIPTKKQAENFYPSNEEWFLSVGNKTIKGYEAKGIKLDRSPLKQGKFVKKILVDFMTSGPIVAIVLQGNEAVKIVRKLVGSTEPLSSDVGTIRGDFNIDSYTMADVDQRAVRNLVHASESVNEAERELKCWFKEEKILRYNLVQDKILYDVNLDGIKE
ncbi:nucleoside-diphosphate kinase [Candidatus Kuenenbacteria bacterium CG23_combo_of_CG06-09_8_20_14_all_36_9]|uniref:nucleoside-diphosphate kinase n=1 Tax=Candidatus Kuenenbacteria bacterium CG10_big_fil_rev_8_21_14_0_10_36_11 TaxID=1974618 RepID=A0A2M6W9Q6_9BACT|nr:MAG: nucleoside-diphosphate kinase [Candidatus Kuenenbacteria bacterium CG23_combo_of_CG06-09_8_20_14_all_36_9]PIT89526.1 MAG: nucleoside-diphosphate kinase [Candidatus Kuenenbacteria bacterium CG10_big_fil_rev_8_21_14_0_10_36_11]